MRGQCFARFLYRFDERVTELLISEMRPHSFDKSLPEWSAAFLVNRFVADYGELVRAWRYKNQNRIALLLRVHT